MNDEGHDWKFNAEGQNWWRIEGGVLLTAYRENVYGWIWQAYPHPNTVGKPLHGEMRLKDADSAKRGADIWLKAHIVERK